MNSKSKLKQLDTQIKRLYDIVNRNGNIKLENVEWLITKLKKNRDCIADEIGKTNDA